jgi:hypothetical protein
VHKLVYANTHGLTLLSCEVEKVGYAVHAGEPTMLIVASAPPGEKEDLIAKMKFKFELVAWMKMLLTLLSKKSPLIPRAPRRPQYV